MNFWKLYKQSFIKNMWMLPFITVAVAVFVFVFYLQDGYDTIPICFAISGGVVFSLIYPLFDITKIEKCKYPIIKSRSSKIGEVITFTISDGKYDILCNHVNDSLKFERDFQIGSKITKPIKAVNPTMIGASSFPNESIEYSVSLPHYLVSCKVQNKKRSLVCCNDFIIELNDLVLDGVAEGEYICLNIDGFEC